MPRETLQTLSRILGWSAILGFALVTLWYGGYASGLLCRVHGQWFGLSEHECAALSYGGMGLLKILVLTLFLVPWLAIKLELRRKR